MHEMCELYVCTYRLHQLRTLTRPALSPSAKTSFSPLHAALDREARVACFDSSGSAVRSKFHT